ncbi:uncharacterized protein MONBRDRAFT_18889 [Monosiga brevicollis MX1]|uniref:glucose-6-phosphate 1-epimerase n=1 Tax=Monosiga brevicollis TaxID=81824 RepID=A9UY64_MONBE|nr:uncharacterized protein MONBRDRAFT_18889 [Monosiga brevicollis MX1]EDQ89969.1 predicted protein [Monosiga brevicollis MX1]|eukprot:XP_001745391.1 hypothetical protein [Monosiga brevicollis MX1]
MASTPTQKKALQDGVTETTVTGTGGHPCPVVELRRGDAKATVHLYGATVTSWTIKSEEFLFLSSKAVLDGKKAIRGGIPLVFPEFGAWKLGPNHGFARVSLWELCDSGTTVAGDVTATFRLTDNEETRAMWPHGFELLYTVALSDHRLTCTLRIRNTGTEAFGFKTLLHTYFRVPHISKVAVHGLQGHVYRDQAEDITIYMNAVGATTVRNVARSRPVTKEDHSSATPSTDMLIAKANLPDTVVWNPWIEKAKAMGDLDDEEYKEFVCVEAGAVAQDQLLPGGESMEFGQVLTVSRRR